MSLKMTRLSALHVVAKFGGPEVAYFGQFWYEGLGYSGGHVTAESGPSVVVAFCATLLSLAFLVTSHSCSQLLGSFSSPFNVFCIFKQHNSYEINNLGKFSCNFGITRLHKSDFLRFDGDLFQIFVLSILSVV